MNIDKNEKDVDMKDRSSDDKEDVDSIEKTARLEHLKARFQNEILLNPNKFNNNNDNDNNNNNNNNKISINYANSQQFGDEIGKQLAIQEFKSKLQPKKKDVVRLEYDRAPKKPIPRNIYYAINMPANVVNDDRAFEAVGGLSQITKVFKSNDVEYLQFKHRPNNPNCRPAFGDKVPTCNLLLRVRKNQSEVIVSPQSTTPTSPTPSASSPTSTATTTPTKQMTSPKSTPSSKQKQSLSQKSTSPPLASSQSSQQQQQLQQQQQPAFSADIIAIIPSTIKFEGMSDFQYIVRPDNKRGEPDQYFSAGDHELKDEELNTIPSIFSRIDRAQPYHFKTNPLASFIPETNRFKIGSKPSVSFGIQAIKFEDTQLPKQRRTIESSNLAEVMVASYNVLKQLFDERPCWTTAPLRDYFQKRGGTLRFLKTVLPFIAYSFINGPWRLCYIRYEYDPRQDVEARIYQVIDFRMDKEASGTSKVRRTFITPRRGAVKLNTFDYQNFMEPNVPLLEGYSPPVYDYTFKEMPNQTRLYQICDIEDQMFKQIVEKMKPTPYCDQKNGWFHSEDSKALMIELKQRCGISIKPAKGSGSSGTTGGRRTSKSKSNKDQEEEMTDEGLSPQKSTQQKQSQKQKRQQQQQQQQQKQPQQQNASQIQHTDDEEDDQYFQDEMEMFIKDNNIKLAKHITDDKADIGDDEDEDLANDAYGILGEMDDDSNEEKEVEKGMDEVETDMEEEDLHEWEENTGDDDDDFNESANSEDHEESFDVEEADNE